MEIPLENLENATPAKVSFIAEQANRLFDFRMETRELLSRESHTTLNWLFGIIIGAGGYVIKITSDPKQTEPDWLLPVLVTAVVCASVAAVYLFHFALRAVEVLPAGDEPKHLVTDGLMACEEHIVRLAAICQMQERIELAAKHNQKVGKAINEVRWAIVAIPFIAAVVAVCFSYFTRNRP